MDKCGDGKFVHFHTTNATRKPENKASNPWGQKIPCDDGNTDSSDGCSSDCWVETNYKCDLISAKKRLLEVRQSDPKPDDKKLKGLFEADEGTGKRIPWRGGWILKSLEKPVTGSSTD
jgi:cysteine-rich repeat protein